MRVHEARFIAGAADAEHLPPGRWPEIAFAGRSNVGKSSLLNRLAGRHALARVSKTPGRTQQINFFLLDERLMFVDLPGYGFARVPLAVKAKWQALVEGYLRRRRQLRGVVVIVDARRGVEPDDAMLLDFLGAHAIPGVLAVTKIDKLNRGARRQRLGELAASMSPTVCTVVGVSAQTGEGTADLWRAISALAD
jgi:GTP-binding protein